MNKTIPVLVVLAALHLAAGAGAQPIVRDHRLGKGRKYEVPKVTRPVVAPTSAQTPIPVAVGGFRVDTQFRDQISFPGNGPSLLAGNPNQVFFSNSLRCGSGTYASPRHERPKELLFYTDTLAIDGPCTLDLSSNAGNENGFLVISCRVLDLKTGGRLTISLSGTQPDKYRCIYLFAEQISLDNKKVFDEAAVLAQFIQHADRFQPPIVRWVRLRVGEKPPAYLRPESIRNGLYLDTLRFDPMKMYVGFLPTMAEVHGAFFSFFSQWVLASYQDLEDKIGRDHTNPDKVTLAKDFIRFRALNLYSDLEQASKLRCTEIIRRINDEKDRNFKNGFQFERIVSVDGRRIRMLSSLTDNAIVNYLPPSLALVSPALVNGKSILGYRVFDESRPDVSTIDFDVVLSCDSRTKSRIEKALSGSNDFINPSFDEMRFTGLAISGSDVPPGGPAITPLGNIVFNIHLGVSNATTLLFNKMFSPSGSGVVLTGKWSNGSADISGDFQIPLSFAKIVSQSVEAANGGIANNSNLPVALEYYLQDQEVVDVSPALLIGPESRAADVYKNDAHHVRIAPDGLTFKLNPETFGDYFEQIDNSDKATQELMVENHIPADPADSLSGFLQYVDVSIGYTLGQKNYQRRVHLAPANAMGSSVTVAILKNSKAAVPLAVSGKAFYENGERDINEVKLDNGESRVDLQEKDLRRR